MDNVMDNVNNTVDNKHHISYKNYIYDLNYTVYVPLIDYDKIYYNKLLRLPRLIQIYSDYNIKIKKLCNKLVNKKFHNNLFNNTSIIKSPEKENKICDTCDRCIIV
jgi:hypothetical protein